MNLLLIIHNQVSTGPYFKIRQMAQALARQGIQVTLLCTSPKNKFRFTERLDEKVQVVESPDLLFGTLRQGMDLWNSIRRIIYLRHKKFDLIHAIDCRPVVILPALWMKKVKKIPLVLSWWDWFGRGGTAEERSGKLYAKTLGLVETFFEEYFRKYADRATVITTALQQRLISLNYPPEKIEIHRVGCDIREWERGRLSECGVR